VARKLASLPLAHAVEGKSRSFLGVLKLSSVKSYSSLRQVSLCLSGIPYTFDEVSATLRLERSEGFPLP
jgi:hypothetical protein